MIKDNEVKKTVNITHKDLREALSTNGSFVIWDSKTGLVYHEKDGFKKIIPSTGNTFGSLEPGLYTIQSNCEWILCTYTSTYRYI